jgi:2-oxoglutarate ferredoxin oxidoreductase subunit alpha
MANMARLGRKFATARTLVPKPIVKNVKGAKVGLIAYGTTHHPVIEALDRLRQQNTELSYLRLRALPTEDTTRDFIERHERVYVVENNNDGQMASLLHMEYPELASRVISLAHLDGMPLTARWITEAVLEQEGVQ